ncbi:MAG: hypothetical protein WC831_03365 [Parcubacteria group bacterium]|jgi:SAM-dependent methyltransferase
MAIFYLIIVLFVGAFILFFSFSYLVSLHRLTRGGAPFVPVPNSVLPEITNALEIKERSVVYDLGCGDGKVLAACYNIQPLANYVGYEISLAVFLLAWIRNRKSGRSRKTKIFRKNFFREDLSKATHVFTYLLPRQMKELEIKFEKEFAPGTRLVSCTFPLENRKPEKVILLNRSKFSIASKLYVYDF